MIIRYLRYLGYEVTCVRNITDIDDKIIKRAQENNEPYFELTERMIKAFHDDIAAINILPADIEPKATQHIPHMIALIQTLLEKKYAYIADNGDVCYAIREFKTYGELAKQSLDEMRSGARVAITESKHDPLDFVLWKLAKPGEPSWESPWGAGRPGWHIECSAMSMDCLGEQFDIHGGGLDLIFPHHQNEIAQSEAATGKKFVNVWMHNGFVQINHEKMSKSLNNFFTLRDVLKEYPAEVVRYFLLASHYRSPINFSAENLESARAALTRFYTTLRDLTTGVDIDPQDENKYLQSFKDAMNDDFNTPEALAVLFDLAREINRVRDEDARKAESLAALLRKMGNILGLLQQNPEDFLKAGANKEKIELIEQLITERNIARQRKNWAEADKIRDKLLALNILLEDSVDGTMWRHK